MDTIKAVVQKVIPEGKHGPFAVARSDQLKGSVTFSLEPTVWKEKERPEEGTVVFLGELRQKRAGWRAKLARFWKPSDEQTERSNAVKFLYPKSRQFWFDEVCEQIVRQLEKRNWQVPGIAVKFDVYGSGEAKFRLARDIEGENFRLHFGRPQGHLENGRWNDTAAVSELLIPRTELHVYDDQSGPTLYIYVGDNWERDRDGFMRGLKVNSKLNGEPRTYLKYKGGWSKPDADGRTSGHQHFCSGRFAPYLVHDDDREYAPKRIFSLRGPKYDAPFHFVTEDIFRIFTNWLENNVLAYIWRFPIPEKRIDAFPPEKPIPFPESIGPLFTFGEWRDEERIKQGKADPAKLEPSDRCVYLGSGPRLAPLGTGGDLPEIAYDGFQWCGVGAVTAKTPIESLEVPGHYRSSDREQFVIRVTPNRANDIYIADHAAYEKRRKEICNAIASDRDHLTDAEAADFIRARARTIVPISEYRGGYEQPVVLISRELSFNEVEVVSGPHEERRFYYVRGDKLSPS